MTEDLLQKAFLMKEQSEETERQLQFVTQQIQELDEFNKSLEKFEKNKEGEILASIGRGVFVKSERKEEKLFVDVGAGVLVRKSVKETREIIFAQIRKFTETKIRLQGQLEMFRLEFGKMLEEVEKMKK